MLKPKIIAVVGPTASGKTSLSIILAKLFSGEVISADSRQIYRQLNIGTAKVTPKERDGIPHHLIDIIEVGEKYSAHDFTEQAETTIAEIIGRGRTPIIAGGTFFYLDLLRGKHQTAKVSPNHILRSELERESTEVLFSRLRELDSTFALKVDKSNRRRLIRALEIITEVGHVPTITEAESKFDWLIIGLQVDKEDLRQRYRKRAETWLKNGFLDEISSLLEQGITQEQLQEIGFEYTLGLQLLEHKISNSLFINMFEQKNWQYAKRQLTWLKRDELIKWFHPNETEAIISTVSNFLSN